MRLSCSEYICQAYSFASARPAWNASEINDIVSIAHIFASTRPAWNASAKMCKAYRAVLWNVS